MGIRGAIFDADGTLLDSMHIYENIGHLYLATKGLKGDPGLREVLRPLSFFEAAEHFREHYKIDEPNEKITADINAIAEDYYYNHPTLKDGVLEFLEALKKKGVKMCVATATDSHLVVAALKGTGIIDYFEKVFTTKEVGFGKLRPDIFIAAHEFLNTDKQFTYIFEDSLYAAKSAKSVGFKVVGISDISGKKSEDSMKELCDIHVDSFRDLFGLLEGLND